MYYNVTVELDSTVADDETTDRIIDTLEAYSPAIGWLPGGHMDVTITLQASGLADAVSEGVHAVQDAAGAAVLSVDAMGTELFDARSGFPALGQTLTG